MAHVKNKDKGVYLVLLVPSFRMIYNMYVILRHMIEVPSLLKILSTIHISKRMNEDQIHIKIMKVFEECGISFQHEYKLLPHKRFDFWIDGIVIEVKKQKPNKISLLNQLNRYTKEKKVRAVIVVLEKSMDLPKMLNGKPISVISLNANWGLAI